MFTYPFGEAAAARVQRLRQQRDLAFIRAVEGTYVGLPNEIAMTEHIRDGAGIKGGFVTPFASNLPLRRRASAATTRLLRKLAREDQELTLLALNDPNWAATVWEPMLPIGKICCEAQQHLATRYGSFLAVIRLAAGERNRPFVPPWEIGADVVAVAWAKRAKPAWASTGPVETVDEHLMAEWDIRAASATLWELSGSDLGTYELHREMAVEQPIDRRMCTPVVRAYQALSTTPLSAMIFAQAGDAGQRLVKAIS